MPELSAFAPTGLLRLSSEPSYGESIYRAMIAALGGSYKVDVGSRMEATIYAQAMGLAESRVLLEHAGRQMLPDQVDEMMGDREREYGLVPGPRDTLAQRQAALAARMLLPRGARREAVVDALAILLGSDFVGYRTTKPTEIANAPTNLGDQPMNLLLPTAPRNLLTLNTAISVGLGASQSVAFTMLTPLLSSDLFPTVQLTDLFVGQKLVIEPENQGRAEVVTIEAMTIASATGGDPPLLHQARVSPLTATFNNAHEPGCLATTAPWPQWTGSQREALIYIKRAASEDAETRRKVNELMQRIARGVSTWAIVAESLPAISAGPFKLDEVALNATPFGLTPLV